MIKTIFVGPSGVRAGWRFLAFLAMMILGNIIMVLVGSVAGLLRQGAFWDPLHFALNELTILIPALLATYVMARLEKRTVFDYGLARGGTRNVWEGLAWGAGAVSFLIGLIWALQGYGVDGFNARGAQLAEYIAVWVVLFAGVGVTEELMFRGYPLFALSRGMGFWPAALALSLLFAAAHLNKPGETLMDIINIALIGVFLAFTILRTGSLWLAIGFHAAFDFFGLFVYSAPNAGEVLPGRLLQASFHGPAWLTGGQLGPEASVLMIPIIALLFIGFHFRHPRTRFDPFFKL